jgi:hypothetical protein
MHVFKTLPFFLALSMLQLADITLIHQIPTPIYPYIYIYDKFGLYIYPNIIKLEIEFN